jgi:hypothetical protein
LEVTFFPSSFSLLAQWNPTELVALPIPPGKSKENEAKEKTPCCFGSI